MSSGLQHVQMHTHKQQSFGDETLLSVGQAMLGMASVVCPAARVGKGTILGGQASAEAGSDLTAQMLYLGAPASALFKSPVRLGVGSLCAPCPACHERNACLVNGHKEERDSFVFQKLVNP